MEDISQLKACPIRWDAHGCPPFRIGADLSFLNRYKKSKINFISLNIGFDLITQAQTLDLIDYIHQWVLKHSSEYEIVRNVQQIHNCQKQNKLSIAFDLEGCNTLNNDINMLSRFYTLGVRQLAFTYNNNNLAGGGCLDKDIGLTSYGKKLVKKSNEIGVLIDCSHVGYKTSLEIIELSEHPTVFSHSNPAALVAHPRNIKDEQIVACAEKDGVIGINGIGIFLGNNDIRTEKIVEHIDYVAQKVGARHVGIGLDCIFDPNETHNYVKKNPKAFPSKYGFNDVAIAQPEQFLEIENLLENKGYSKEDIDNILGGNFLRVAKVVWK